MMKRTLFLTFVLILVVATAKPQTPNNASWSVYTVKGERLSIALPALPAMQTSTEMRARPQKDRQRRVIKCSVNGVIYTIDIVENPKPRLSLESFIKEQAAANSGENLTSERNLTLDGVTGKAFNYSDGKGMVQFFATDDRLYGVRAYGASVDDPRIATFFHYVSLKKQEGALQISETVQAGSFDTSMGGIFKGKEVDTKVRLIKKPEPSYTDDGKRNQVTGVVILKCVFAGNGTVTNIRVVSGLPYGLTEKAIEAARKIKFIPATKDGKNVSMWMQLEYNFNLY